MARFKASNLVEFFTVVAVVAMFSAILVPITAQAKQAAGTTTTVTNLRLVGMAALAYATDNNDRIVQPQLGASDSKNKWPVLLSRYVANRSTFFDPTRAVPTGLNVVVSGITMPWFNGTSLGINDGGYTGHIVTLGGTCGGRRVSYQYGGRTLSGLSEPNKRVAFAPTSAGTTSVGWPTFHAYESNLINTGLSPLTFSYANTVWSTNTLYTNHLIPVVHADGSAGTLSRADFKSTTEAPDINAYCAWMSTEGQRTWGPFWRTD